MPLTTAAICQIFRLPVKIAIRIAMFPVQSTVPLGQLIGPLQAMCMGWDFKITGFLANGSHTGLSVLTMSCPVPIAMSLMDPLTNGY
jgi:hypothetical protein